MKKTLFLILMLLVFNPNVFSQTDTNKIDNKGLKQGKWRKWDKNILKYEGQFLNDKPFGEFRYYYPDKKLKTIVDYSKNGELSKAITYYPEGKKMSDGTYWKQKKDSTWRYYNDSDTLLSIELYDKGVKTGVWSIFYPSSGKLYQTINYKADMKEGDWIEYYENGTIKSKSNYQKDVLNGLFKHFYSSGKTKVSGTYSNGLKSGTWMYFKESGLSLRMEKYANNKLIEEKIFVTVGTNRNFPVYCDSIAYIYKKGDTVHLMLKNASKLAIDNKIDEMEEVLGDQRFLRINKQIIIKLDAIQSTEEFESKQVKLNLKPPCEIEVIADEDKSAILRSWNRK